MNGRLPCEADTLPTSQGGRPGPSRGWQRRSADHPGGGGHRRSTGRACPSRARLLQAKPSDYPGTGPGLVPPHFPAAGFVADRRPPPAWESGASPEPEPHRHAGPERPYCAAASEVGLQSATSPPPGARREACSRAVEPSGTREAFLVSMRSSSCRPGRIREGPDSAVSGWATGWVSARTWVAAAGRPGLTLLIPSLRAVTEVRALEPPRGTRCLRRRRLGRSSGSAAWPVRAVVRTRPVAPDLRHSGHRPGLTGSGMGESNRQYLWMEIF